MTQEAGMMATTQIWRTSRVRAAARHEARTRNGRAGSRRRAGPALWALLHAPGLINGTAGSQDDVMFIEDDRARMTGWRRS